MFTLSFPSPACTLPVVGGKGANLARLAQAGFLVPPGFFVTTDAYCHFVTSNQLAPTIAAALASLGEHPDPLELEAASTLIRTAFARARAPHGLMDAVGCAWQTLAADAVAVRSSATAEDLPDLSFAGQQDTYLNVVGETAVMEAVIGCFSSLWTARAIGYRHRNHIAQESVALAVVVQAMVQSEASGVLFTANPLTGHREETVIDATHGLGEALVSGQVEPDHYVVETATGQIRSRTQGAKRVSIVSKPGGGVERVEETGVANWALPEDAVADLVRLGSAVQAHYGGEPQDIEWALAGGRLHLLQARPITSLFPLPPGLPSDPPALLFSFGAVQGMLDPLTPIGQDVFREISSDFARLWGFDYPPGAVPALHFAGERMWLRFDPLLRNRATAGIWRKLFPLIEAGSREPYAVVMADAGMQPLRALPKVETFRRLLPVLGPAVVRFAGTWGSPQRRCDEALAEVEALIARLEVQAAQVRSLAEGVAMARQMLDTIVPVFVHLLPVIASGIGAIYRMLALTERAGIPQSTTLGVLRGLPHNVTTTMDLALWEVARTLQASASTRSFVRETPAAELASRWLQRSLPAAVQTAADRFLAVYGMRGVAEIDLGRRRWREDPTQVFQMVQNYLEIADPESAPDLVFKRGEAVSAAATAEVVANVRNRLGAPQGRLTAFFVSRVRALAGLRETPKFTIIRIFGCIRQVLLVGYGELVAAGKLDAAEDGVFLSLRELEAAAAGYAIDWRALVRVRKSLYERELRRRQVPRLLLGDGRAFYGGAPAGTPALPNTRALQGTPVSPGIVEGVVHVVFNPHGARLAPGEILVCPGTDPAWTPLFLSAGGLVMEVGGLMTHGSVVAREYGIPAVVGVPHATDLLQTGMRIRIDGASGAIQVLKGVEPAAS
jgi:pyruvate,water dikinase